MEDGGYGALLYHLLHEVDITRVNLRKIPHTVALIDQKIEGATTEQSWWLDVLREGVLPGDWEGTGSAPSKLLFDDYIEHAKKKGVARRSIETSLGFFLNDHVEGLTDSRQTYLMPKPPRYDMERKTKRSRVYHFPTLAECREQFAREQLDEVIAWDEEDWSPAEEPDEAVAGPPEEE
jgi:hypothetical protein